ncbi:MAG: FHA domain-containing protein [Heteroscytonema crispum UTEX LB 1556]
MKLKISKSPTQSEFDEIDLSLTTRRGTEYFIGRSPDSDLVLDSEDVSRQHGKFFFQSGNYYFCDLGSRNGTIINGKLAEKNHSYILKNGDLIRIGDFALMLEEDISASEQSETVVRIINPSTFSNWKSSQNPSISDVATPSSELLNQPQEVPEPVISESIGLETPIAKEINTSEELTFAQSDEALVANSAEIVIPHNTGELPADSEISDVISHESVKSDTPVEAEATANISGVKSEYTIVQVQDVLQDDENNIDSDAEEIAAQTEEDDAQEAISQENNIDSDAEEIAAQTPEGDAQEAISQENNIDSDAEEIAAQTEEDDAQEAISQKDNFDADAEEIAAQTEEDDAQEAETEIIEAANNNVSCDTLITEEREEELVSETASISTSESVAEELKVISKETEKDAVENVPEEESFVKLAKILEDKQIVLIAHETKKSKLTELVAEHEEFLSYCLTRTWQTFSDYLYRETGLSVTQEIPPATSGGYQAINSLINSGEIIAVIFLRDFIVPQPGQASEEALLRTCNINEILLATNLPTAQAVINYLKNIKDS